MGRKAQDVGNRPRRKTHRRRSRTSLLLLILAGAVVLVAGGYLVAGRGRGSSAATTSAPVLSVSPAFYDLGQVSQAAGIVTIRLALANTGGADLVISEMETSCGCTRAAVVLDGQQGPWFGMKGHGEWPTGWSASVRPGQKGTLLVQYDPDAHGIYRGPIDREIAITSNDPRQRQVLVRLSGTQVP